MKIQALNGKDDQFTLAALKAAASKATGQARATIQGLIQSLHPQPAARGRFAKEASVKKHHKRAGKKLTAKRKTNPSRAKRTHKVTTWRKRSTRGSVRHNPTRSSGLSGKLNTGTILEVLKDGGLTVAGSLASSFVERQIERMFPSIPPLARAMVSGVSVAGLALYMGGKALGKPLAVGSITQVMLSAAQTFAPGLFSGMGDEEAISGAQGYWDENNQWVMSGADGMAGLAYSLADPVPSLAVRPAGF